MQEERAGSEQAETPRTAGECRRWRGDRSWVSAGGGAAEELRAWDEGGDAP